jgi:hypothetical protein
MRHFLNNPLILIKQYQKAMAGIRKTINRALDQKDFVKIKEELEHAQQDTIKLFSQIRNDRAQFANSPRREEARSIFANSWCSENEIELAIIAAIKENDEEFRSHLPVSTDKNKILALSEAFVYELIDPFSPNFAQDRKW